MYNVMIKNDFSVTKTTLDLLKDKPSKQINVNYL